MAFPSNPSRGDTYLTDDTTWTYDGVSWYRTIIGSNNSTTYSTGGFNLPTGGATGQVLQRAAGGGLEWGDGGGTDVSTLIARLEALEATLQNTDYLIL